MLERRRRLALGVLSAGLAAGLALAPPVLYGSQKPDETAEEETAQPDLPAAKVGKDPATGRMRAPTQEENDVLARELRKALARHRPHKVRENPDGSLSLVAAPQFLALSVARIAPDGTVELDCAESPEEAAAILDARSADPARLPKE